MDMPTYQYSCSDCGHDLEAVQSFTDDSLVDCPACGKPALRKVFGNVGVVFKGPGFYRTDSRKDGSPAATGKADSAAKKEGAATAGSSSTDSGKDVSTKPSAKSSGDGAGSGSGGTTASTKTSGSSAG